MNYKIFETPRNIIVSNLAISTLIKKKTQIIYFVFIASTRQNEKPMYKYIREIIIMTNIRKNTEPSVE